MKESLDLLLPLVPAVEGRGSDLERVRCGLLPSLCKFLPNDRIINFIVVTPKQYVGDIARSISEFNGKLTINIIQEETVVNLNHSTNLYNRGWYIQQLIKLAWGKHARSRFYLTLDADVFLTREYDLSFLDRGVSPVHFEEVKGHGSWWEASAETLHMHSLQQIGMQQAMGVTPAFIHSKSCGDLVDYLNGLAVLSGFETWEEYLFSRCTIDDKTWTEYSLYWTYMVNCMRDQVYHFYRPVYKFFHYVDIGALQTRDVAAFAVLQSSFLDNDQHSGISCALLNTQAGREA